MKLGRAGVFGVTQIFLMDGGGLEAGTELVEGGRCQSHAFKTPRGLWEETCFFQAWPPGG